MSRRYVSCAVLFLVAAMWSRRAMSVAQSDVGAAQSPSIAGKVIDSTGEPLPGVSITAGDGGIARQSTSASDGVYRFDALPDRTYRIDFELPGFDLFRRNNVRVLRGTTAKVDAALSAGRLCECVSGEWSELRERDGQVVDESGRPLPNARLEVVYRSSREVGREVALSDREGRFRIRLPASGTWPLTASDNGFSGVTQQVSGTTASPIIFALPSGVTRTLPDSEPFYRGCCAGELFVHPGRWGHRNQ